MTRSGGGEGVSLRRGGWHKSGRAMADVVGSREELAGSKAGVEVVLVTAVNHEKDQTLLSSVISYQTNSDPDRSPSRPAFVAFIDPWPFNTSYLDGWKNGSSLSFPTAFHFPFPPIPKRAGVE